MAEYYVFAGDYNTGMDRYYAPVEMGMGEMPINKIGISTPPMKEQLESLKARIFQGASRVELGFMGVQKGSMGQGSTTPEMYGQEEREAIRDLAKINKVELTTHAAPQAAGAAGFDPRQGKFSEEHQQFVIDEIKRTIEFAAETAGGVPVVVHTGEWNRPIVEAEKSAEYYGKFEAFPGEKKKAAVLIVDEKTGEVMPIPKDIEIFEPEEKDGKYQYEKDGTVVMKKMAYNDILEESKKKYPDLSEEKAIFRYFNDANMRRAKAEMLRFLEQKEDADALYDNLGKQKQYWAELEKKTPKDRQDVLRASFQQSMKIPAEEGISLSESIEKKREELKRNLTWIDEISIQAK